MITPGPNSTRRITVHDASLKTATVEVKALTLNGKQMTLSVFRQLQNEQLLDDEHLTLRGNPWGKVNYFWGHCEPDHLHVVWEKDGELRRACVYSHRDFGISGRQHADMDTLDTQIKYYGRLWVATELATQQEFQISRELFPDSQVRGPWGSTSKIEIPFGSRIAAMDLVLLQYRQQQTNDERVWRAQRELLDWVAHELTHTDTIDEYIRAELTKKLTEGIHEWVEISTQVARGREWHDQVFSEIQAMDQLFIAA